MKRQKPVAFVEHPITDDEKFEITSKGFKIVDLKYKPEKLPEGAKVFEKPKAKK
ncbi:hypothetical protein [Vibrio phage LP.2]|nr:hypothetical protein [Vibrio phage LP.2]